MKKNIKRFVFFILLGTLPGGFLFSQAPERPYWFTLEQGKLLFREGQYGDALIAFEDARRQRETMFTRMEQDLIFVLSLPEVRRLGDSLSRVETYIQDRGYDQADKALRELYYRVPREELNNSAAAALEKTAELKGYPEAEFWLGECYRAEGELGVALRQYRKAYDLRALLQTPGADTEILYSIADIHRMRREYIEMEECYLKILELDYLWSEDSETFVKNAMTRTLENEGIDRFLTLYRYDNTVVEKAHRLLGFYYYYSGRYGRASEHLLFAFLIQNTVLIEEMLSRRFDYQFTETRALMTEISAQPVLSAYLSEVEYYKTIYYLGSSLYANGKLGPARNFWILLRGRAEAGEWRTRGEAQLRTPFVEKAVEMP
ncbi:hypothetical protein [Breznakiella homolactica]|uniref:Tetratricopeptide repeat protein n=1 Tax=Breznakiella homolactica TaxID=2798577 RepID=A0A7T7XKZ2_9SPIR|nr:hypothetical protein [Breznakiella homolactica]QQO08216.1 hypothetical protein JFL75_14925 [Breznakiella homolactica]